MKMASESKARARGPVCGIETPYGAVFYYPETAEQLTFLALAGEKPLRVRGALKRLLITLCQELRDEKRKAAVLRHGLAGGTN